jgi:hypothetical protein
VQELYQDHGYGSLLPRHDERNRKGLSCRRC